MARDDDNESERLAMWGCFRLISKEPAEDSDHIYLRRRTHRIGRSAQQCDIVLSNMGFVSATHCIVTIEGIDDNGDPIVTLKDMSRNGIYVNGELIGKGNSTLLQGNYTIHFTKPGQRQAGISPTVYRFELLSQSSTDERTQNADTATADTLPALEPVIATQRIAQTPERVNSSHKRLAQETAALSTTEESNLLSSSARSKRRRLQHHRDEDEGEIEETKPKPSAAWNTHAQEIVGSRQQDTSTTQSIEDLKRQYTVLELKLEDHQREMTKHRNEAAERDKKFEEILRENQQLTEELRRSKQEQEQFKADAKNESEARQMLQEEMETKTRQMQEMKTFADTVDEQLQAVRSQLAALEKQVETLHTEKAELQDRLDGLKQRKNSQGSDDSKSGSQAERSSRRKMLETLARAQTQMAKHFSHFNLLFDTAKAQMVQQFNDIANSVATCGPEWQDALLQQGFESSSSEPSQSSQTFNSLLSSEQSQPTPGDVEETQQLDVSARRVDTDRDGTENANHSYNEDNVRITKRLSLVSTKSSGSSSSTRTPTPSKTRDGPSPKSASPAQQATERSQSLIDETKEQYSPIQDTELLKNSMGTPQIQSVTVSSPLLHGTDLEGTKVQEEKPILSTDLLDTHKDEAAVATNQDSQEHGDAKKQPNNEQETEDPAQDDDNEGKSDQSLPLESSTSPIRGSASSSGP